MIFDDSAFGRLGRVNRHDSTLPVHPSAQLSDLQKFSAIIGYGEEFQIRHLVQTAELAHIEKIITQALGPYKVEGSK